MNAFPSNRTIFTFNRAQDLIIPPTAEEIMKFENSTNTTMFYSQITDANDNDHNLLLNEKDNKENLRVIILGFNDFDKNSENISYFDMYFTTLNKNFVSSFMKIPINIKYKNSLRHLENENYNYSLSVCYITQEYKKNRANCQVLYKDGQNIDILEIIPNFTFVGEENVILNFSPIANKQKNNIINIDNIDYSNYTLYVLENSSYVKNGKRSFNISGIIKDISDNYTKDSFVFTLNNNNNEDTSSEVKCKFVEINKTNDNHTLNCESNQELNVNLDFGISINKDQKIILLITFNNPNGTDSQIETEESEKSESDKANKINFKKSILIIVLPILAIIAVIASIFLKI